MRNIRNGVTPGWLGFSELRARPQGDYRRPCHGNTKHGDYAKSGREGMASVRLLKAMLRGRYTPEMAALLPKQPPGWRLYPYVRNPILTRTTPARTEADQSAPQPSE